MKAQTTIFTLLTLFTSYAVALPAPLPNAEPAPGSAAVRDVLKRAGATFYSCSVPNTVALTFDDGPYIWNLDIANILSDAGAKGTFFLNGNNWDCIYDRADSLRTIYNQGHQVASHTWSHSDLTTLSWDQIHDEMWRVELALQRIVGVTPAHMRPPYGNYNQLVLDAANVRGQNVILWDFDSGDSTGTPPEESKQMYDDLVAQHPDTILALNHETYSSTAYDVLPHAIQVLQDAGYNLVTVAECLGQSPYQSVGSPGQPTSDWHC